MKILNIVKSRKKIKEEISNANNTLQDYLKQIEELKKKLPYLKGQVTRAKNGTGKKTVNEAEAEFTDAQHRIRELEILIKENTAKIEGLQVKLNALKLSNILKAKINNIKFNRKEKRRIKGEISDKKEKLQELDEEYEQNPTKEKFKEITFLEAEIQNLEEELKKFSFIAKIANLVNKKSKLKKDIAEKKAVYDNCIQEQKKLKNKVSSKKALVTRVKNGTGKKTLAEAEKELEDAKKAYSKNEEEIKKLEKEIEELEQQLVDSTPKISKKSIIITIIMVVMLVVLILVLGIVARSCSHQTDSFKETNQPSATETTEVPTIDIEESTEIVTEELTEPTEAATEETTEEPTEEIKNSDGLSNSGVINSNSISVPPSHASSDSDSSDEDYYEVVEDSEQNKSEDMNSSKDSNKDQGVTGGNKGYGATISSEKESPVPEEIFEEKNPLPPAVTEEEINEAPIINLTPAN